MSRTFRACVGRTVTLPASVKAGPGATTMRLDPGCVVTLTEAEIVANQRFVNGRLRAGDLEEVDASALVGEAPEPTLLPKEGTFVDDDGAPKMMPIDHGIGPKKGGSQ